MASPPPLPETDLSLLHRFAARGDEDAFSEIVRRYAGVVFSACHRVLRDKGWAEDVAQETFFRLVRNPDKVSHSLGGWLHRTGTRLAVDTLRSERARHRRESSYEAPVEDTDDEETGQSRWAEVSPFIDESLGELDEESQELLVRHFLQGTPQAELAEEAGVSAATMSRRVKHAIMELRQKLAKKGVAVAPAMLLLLCARNAAEAAPAPLMNELGKMAMVSGATTKASATGSIPSWAEPFCSPGKLCKAVAREWPRVSMCAAVGLGLYLAFPYVPLIRAHRNMPPRQPPEERREEPTGGRPTGSAGVITQPASWPTSSPSPDSE